MASWGSWFAARSYRTHSRIDPLRDPVLRGTQMGVPTPEGRREPV